MTKYVTFLKTKDSLLLFIFVLISG